MRVFLTGPDLYGNLTKITFRFTQHMVFMEGPHKGKPKGLRIVCGERFGMDFVKGAFGLAWFQNLRLFTSLLVQPR